MEPGDRVDRFLVEARLGQGGMATVYRVRHASLGSPHALKILDLPYPSVRNRLVLEGRVQAGLAHPNIVSVTDLVEVDGAPGLIMEYVPGPSLDAWLAEHRPDPATADAIFRGILDAVGHAHRQGLIHRDLKPGNVLLHFVDGRVVPKVADFGLAKLISDDTGPMNTRTGFAMGTPGYMAPEQIRSAKDVDVRADVFALGVILFELWCGVRPFHGDSVYDVLVAIERREYPAPRTLRADLPLGVESAILGCIEPEVDRRLATVDAIRMLLDGDRVPPPGPGGASRASAEPAPGVSTLPPEIGTVRSGATFVEPERAMAPSVATAAKSAPVSEPARVPSVATKADSARAPEAVAGAPQSESVRRADGTPGASRVELEERGFAPVPAAPGKAAIRRRAGGAGTTWVVILVIVLLSGLAVVVVALFVLMFLGGVAGLSDTGF